jgi:hypothetical protein
MKRFMLLISFLCTTGTTAAQNPVAKVEVWVSPAGSDAAAGSEEQPWATLEKARDAIRERRKANGPIQAVVHLKEGLHTRTSTFALGPDDSGTAARPVIIQAEGLVRLHAGRNLKPGDFQPVKDAAAAKRLAPEARGKVVQLALEPLGLKHPGPLPNIFNDGGKLLELYFNDQRMPLSRWPNEGHTTMEKVLDRGDWSKTPERRGGRFIAREDRIARWNVETGVWLEGYWRVPWDPQCVRVKSIDPKTREIVLAEPVAGGIGSKYAKPGQLGDGKEPWCAVNLLEEIDRPGEWCIDFPTKTLYFWPPKDLSTSRVFLSDFGQPIISAKDASHIQFRGITLEGGLGHGIDIQGGSRIELLGCTLRNLGGGGVFVRGGTNHLVKGCDLYALGQGGIYLGGGDRAKLVPCGNTAENNHIHHVGVLKKTYGAGIHVGAYGIGDAVGCRVAHNLIHDLPHAGVLYGGNDNIFEFNEVLRVVLTSGDMGAFYTSHDWTSRGNILRHNFVHDSPRANAFYMDDGDDGDEIFGNVAQGCSYGPFIGGGHDNIVRNNIVIATERGLHLDQRGISRGYDNDKSLRTRLDGVEYKAPPWSQRYPALVTILDTNPALPRGNVLEANVLVGCKVPVHLSGKKDELRFNTIGTNLELTEKEAAFRNPAQGDFGLKPESAVFKKLPGFKPIPFEKIGLVKDSYRTSIPARSFGHTTLDRSGIFDSNTDLQSTPPKK